MKRSEIAHIDGVGPSTRREDNTDAERLAAVRFLATGAQSASELDEWLSMLGIEKAWIDGSPAEVPQTDRRRAVPRRTPTGGMIPHV